MDKSKQQSLAEPEQGFWRRVRTMLYKHYTASQRKIFKQFRLGVGLFFVGLVGVYANYNLLTESLGQELFLLTCLVVIVTGFIIAILAQIRLLVGRILHFIYH